MQSIDNDSRARLRAIADSLDCLIPEDLRLLADCTVGTEEAWRKRGTGPAYILFGKNYLYPRKPLVKFLEARTRERQASGKAFL